MRRQQILGAVLIAAIFLLLIPDGITDSAPEEFNHDSLREAYEWNVLTSKNGQHIRKKRLTLVAAAGVASALLGAGFFVYGVVNGQQRLAELKNIQSQLKGLDRKIDSIFADLRTLVAGQERLQATILYGRDVSRLRFFLSYLADRLDVQADKSLGPGDLAKEWAESVLHLGSDGVAQVLHNFHDMVMGHSPIFGGRSIFVLLEERLNRDSSQYTSQVREIAEYLHSVQVSGYAAWATALNIKGRISEVPHVQNLGRNRLAAQKAIIDPLTLEWPSGTYGLPETTTGCPVASGVTWQDGFRYHDNEDTHPNNRWTSGGIHFPINSFDKNNMYQQFCMKTTSSGSGAWPSGNYCIFKKDTCPSGFRWGKIYWDDEDSNNANRVNGYLPDGLYDSNTQIEYCCRDDGSYATPIPLPSHKPFYLFRYSTHCQTVIGMNVREEFFHWDDEDKNNNNAKEGSYPRDDGGSTDHKLYYCYYY